MDDHHTINRVPGSDLFPILMVNCFFRAIAMIVSVVVLRQTGMYPIFAGGTVIAIIAVSKAGKERKNSV